MRILNHDITNHGHWVRSDWLRYSTVRRSRVEVGIAPQELIVSQFLIHFYLYRGVPTACDTLYQSWTSWL